MRKILKYFIQVEINNISHKSIPTKFADHPAEGICEHLENQESVEEEKLQTSLRFKTDEADLSSLDLLNKTRDYNQLTVLPTKVSLDMIFRNLSCPNGRSTKGNMKSV
jgi:hypothetical protein